MLCALWMNKYNKIKVHTAGNLDISNCIYTSSSLIDYRGGLRFGRVANLFSILLTPPVNNNDFCHNYPANVDIWYRR